jgi:hypothetical protein
MPAIANQKELAQASFIFQGTVVRAAASTMPNVPVTAKTLIVRVDKILQAPKLLSSYEGKDITVQLTPGKTLKSGQHATFYANPWLFGESVAVQSIGFTPVAAATTSRLASAAKAIRSTRDLDLEQHLAAADVVVRGRVLSVGLPEVAAPRAGKTAATPGGLRRLSEHSANWNEAIVEVESVAKGRQSAKQIAVRFPRSTDVAWANAPKFEPGQEGLFILHQAESKKGKQTAKRVGTKKTARVTYEALHAHDFVAKKNSGQVEALIQSAATKKPIRKRSR